jgi:hypothetical protein
MSGELPAMLLYINMITQEGDPFGSKLVSLCLTSRTGKRNRTTGIDHSVPRDDGARWKIVKCVSDQPCLARQPARTSHLAVCCDEPFRNTQNRIPDLLMGMSFDCFTGHWKGNVNR